MDPASRVFAYVEAKSVRSVSRLAKMKTYLIIGIKNQNWITNQTKVKCLYNSESTHPKFLDVIVLGNQCRYITN